MECNMETIDVISNVVIAITAIVAAVVSYFGYVSHKKKERNKLLSQLNQRYINNADMQAVVKYLRKIDPENEEPSTYQTELFLRFFEELGVYLRNDNRLQKDVKNFFEYYFERLYSTERGKKLLARINNEENRWAFLNEYKKRVGFNNDDVNPMGKTDQPTM